MRDIIKKILRENINPQINVGDIFITSGTKEKDLIRITDIRCGGNEFHKEFNTPDWGKQVIEYDGCDLTYQVSTDQGITWEYESEDGHWVEWEYESEGRHWVEVAWIKNLIEKGWWELLHKNVDFFDILNESEEEDNLEWAREVISHSLINVGDVFYIVDSNAGINILPWSYRPNDVRYVLTIVDTGPDWVKYTTCDPNDVTYDKNDYTPENDKCRNNRITKSDLVWVMELVDKHYWRRM